MKLLKQSTATTIVVGPIVDSVDASAETAQTIAQADVLLWKEGGTTLAQKNDTSSATHRSNGLYTVPLNTTDTNTLGQLIVNVAKSGTLVFRDDYMVVPANVYDSLVLGSANLLTQGTSNIKKNQALNNFMFLMTDATTHAPATGKTVTASRAIDGGAFGSGTLGSVTEIANGWYKLNLGSGDLNGNNIALRFTATGCDDTNLNLITVP
jgi:hypothetical protein